MGVGLNIGWNGSLENLDGLENLHAIGGALFIYSNAALTSVSGLQRLSSIGARFEIQYNSVLCQSLVAELLDHIDEIGGHTAISFNDESC